MGEGGDPTLNSRIFMNVRIFVHSLEYFLLLRILATGNHFLNLVEMLKRHIFLVEMEVYTNALLLLIT